MRSSPSSGSSSAPEFRSLADGLRDLARAQPDTPATIVARSTFGRLRYEVTTFAELDRDSEEIAAGLAASGVSPGTKVAMLVPPTHDFFALAFALMKAGAVPVLIDPGIGVRPLRECLAEADPAVFIGVPKAHLARALLSFCPNARLRVAVGWFPECESLDDVRRLGRERLPTWRAPKAEPDALAGVLFTSGSTGVPKGVEYLHRHFAAQVEIIRALYGIEPGEMNLATFPPFALFGPALGMSTLIPKMDPTRPAKLDPTLLLDAAERYAPTLMFGSPAVLDTLGRHGERTGAKLPSLRRVISAGAPVMPRSLRRFCAMLADGVQVFTPYGATESLPVCNVGSAEVFALERTGVCVGRPAPSVRVGIMPITDEPVAALSATLPVGEVGEVVVAGPNVTLAYHLRERATALAKTVWDGQTAHRMGDLGWFDASGRLWFAGRKAHRVTLAGGGRDGERTLFSVCVEEVFNVHPEVFRTALVGVGGAPVLCVELEPGARPTTALTEALLELGRRDPDDTGAALVARVLYHPGFPVDIRHNSKINREALARWASEGDR